MSSKKIVTDAYQWSYNRYIRGNPELVEFSAEMRVRADIAQRIYDIRHKLLMSREDLVEFSGLTPESVEDIEDIEESDYDGDWDEAVRQINRAFERWIKEVILPASRMTPDEYLIKTKSA